MIVKSGGLTTPSSRPTVRKTISVTPRAFIRVPMVRPSRHDSPASRAATVAPPSLPSVATTRTSRAMSHRPAEVSWSILIDSPTSTKKIGSSRFATMPSSCRSTRRCHLPLRGITAPARKPPKTAWIPTCSAAHALNIATAMTPHTGTG
jgi:hypothetical protein